MQPSIEKLQKFFKLEADMGFNNRAVIGGFEKIAASWEAEARADQLPEDLVQAISERLRNYGRLSPASRQEALQGLWRRIQRTISGSTELPFNDQRTGHAAASKVRAEAPGEAPVELPAEMQAEMPAEVPAEVPAEIPQLKTADPQKTATPKPITSQPEPKKTTAVAAKTRPAPTEPPAALDAPVTALKGIGKRIAQTLERLGINTLHDMLYYFPRRYVDYSTLKPINRLWYGEEVTVIGSVGNIQTRTIKNGKMQVIEALLSDSSGKLRLTWFNQPWIVQRLQRNPHISVSGKIEQYLGRLVIYNPEWEPLTQQQLHTNRIVPVYPLTSKITQTWLRRQMNSAVTFWAPRLVDPLPEAFCLKADLMDLPNAILQVHFPESWELLNAARHRLAFDEIFYLQLGVLDQKRRLESRTARQFAPPDEWMESQVARLPFELTSAQQRALAELQDDLRSGTPMNRLLQGDVGSGKTIVAALAVGTIAREGAQSAVMAPTSILAEQHYRSFQRYLVDEPGILQPEEIRMLIGATPPAEKEEIRQGLASGQIKLVVGTHALIEEIVQFRDLELIVIDEQHRFGVEQRAALRTKGTNPHLLVMTATPIPRSLALTLYGDLDLSIMDEMPPGREPVATYILHPGERERAYSLIRQQIAAGHQAFIIYPLVEESETSELPAAVAEAERLQKEIYPDLSVGLVHGRMRSDEKEAAMANFRDQVFDILVSTSVVEVGVDIPNATVMLVEGANRFGLAQLHQLRGRVGRGADKAICILIPDTSDSIENERLAAMSRTNDGFELAEIDLDQRGPGDFLGIRQSGYLDLRMASISDIRLIEKARHFAQEIFNQDPALSDPDHELMGAAMQAAWQGISSGDIS